MVRLLLISFFLVSTVYGMGGQPQDTRNEKPKYPKYEHGMMHENQIPPNIEKVINSPEVKNRKNPIAYSQGIIEKGNEIFDLYCYTCHGKSGSGDGPARHYTMVSPAKLISEETQSRTDGQLFYIISKGNIPMPSHDDILSDDETWYLVHYIRELAKK